MGGVPFRGDAWTWWGQVPDYSSWTRNSIPPTNKPSIAWWGGDPGHVAHVAQYSGGSTTVDITEMSYCTSCGNSRNIDRYDPGGYIYRVYQPQSVPGE